jgi:hypothetical protein
MSDLKYFTYEMPASPPANSKLVGSGYEYRGFYLDRDREYLLWSIQTLERTNPPISLRGRFTSLDKAKQVVDDFLAEEARQKETVQ